MLQSPSQKVVNYRGIDTILKLLCKIVVLKVSETAQLWDASCISMKYIYALKCAIPLSTVAYEVIKLMANYDGWGIRRPSLKWKPYVR